MNWLRDLLAVALALVVFAGAPARAGHGEPILPSQMSAVLANPNTWSGAQTLTAPVLKYSDATTAISSAVKAITQGSGQHEIDFSGDYYSFQSGTAMTGPNPVTIGGTCTAGNTVGINLTSSATPYTPRYTVQSSDCSASSPLASIALGLAAAIQTALNVPATNIGAVAYFNLFYSSGWATSGYAGYTSGGASETVTVGSIISWLEISPQVTLLRDVAGRDAMAGDLIGAFLVLGYDSSGQGGYHASIITTSIVNPAAASYQTALQLLSYTGQLYLGNGLWVGNESGSVVPTGLDLGAGTINVPVGHYVNDNWVPYTRATISSGHLVGWSTYSNPVSGNTDYVLTDVATTGSGNGVLATSPTIASPTLTGTVTEPDSSTWTSSGIGSLVALGVGESVPAAGIINVSSKYEVAGAQISTASLSDTTACTSYSPTDQSGAGLTLSTAVQYCKYGNLVYVYGRIVYPSTSNTSAAAISLPVPVPSQGYAWVPAVLVGSGATINAGSALEVQRNTSTAAFLTLGNTSVTNSELSGQNFTFMLVYPAS